MTANAPVAPLTRAARIRKIAGTVASSVLLGTVVIGGIMLIAVPMLTHSKPLTVLTGSMKGTYDPGSIVVVHPIKPADLKVGDTLTYQIRSDEPDVITHRVVAISFGPDGKRRFITRGDANGANDPVPVKEGQVRGTVWYHVPLVGYASTALSPTHRNLGLKLLSGGLVSYGAWLFVGGLRDRRRRVEPSAP